MKIIQMSVFEPWPIEDESVQAIITSQPYYQKRIYSIPDILIGGNKECAHKFDENNFCVVCHGWLGQYGREKIFQHFIAHTLLWCKEAYRVLKPGGMFFLNVGDSFTGSNNGSDNVKGNKIRDEKYKEIYKGQKPDKQSLPDKCKMLIPERIAMALCDELNFRLRNTLIWHKTTGMPECLDSNTTVIIKDNNSNYIKVVSLGELFNKSIKNISILSPNGWKTINNIWKVTKNNYCSFEAGKFTKIQCGLDHKFPVTHSISTLITHNKPITDIKDKGYTNYIFTKSIEYAIENRVNTLNLLDVANSLNYPLDKIIIKFPNKLLGFSAKYLSEKYNFKLSKHKLKKYWTYVGQIVRFLSNSKLPGNVVLGEKIDYSSALASFYNHRNYEPLNIKLDYISGKFLGLYIAEGGFSKYQGKLTFNKKEIELISFVNDFLKNRNIPTNIYTKNNYTSIQFNPSILKLFINYFVQGKCKTKSLFVDRILNTNKDFIKGIFDGYITGDGSTTTYGFSVTSTSNQLINDMQVIGSALGYILSKYVNKIKDTKRNKIYTAFVLKSAYLHRKQTSLGSAIRIRNKLIINECVDFIEIEVEDNLFIINNGVVSHNSCKDRFSQKWEPIFMFSKNGKYDFYLNSVLKPFAESTKERAKGKFHSEKVNEESSFVSNKAARKWYDKVLSGEVEGANPGDVFLDTIFSEETYEFTPFSTEEHTTILGVEEFKNLFNFISVMVSKYKNITLLNGISLSDLAVYNQNINNCLQEIISSCNVKSNFIKIFGCPYATISIEYSSNKIIIKFGRNVWIFCNETFSGNNEKSIKTISQFFAINIQSVSSPFFFLFNYICGLPLPFDVINQLNVFRTKTYSETFSSMKNTSITHEQAQNISLMRSNFAKIFFIESVFSSAYIFGSSISKQFMVMPTTEIFTNTDFITPSNFTTFFHLVNITDIYEKSKLNPGDVWHVTKSNSKLKHYAQWSEELVQHMIKCSTKAEDIVLDPFCGVGTTLKVAKQLHRKGMGIDMGYSDTQIEKLSNIQSSFFI